MRTISHSGNVEWGLGALEIGKAAVYVDYVQLSLKAVIYFVSSFKIWIS